MKKLNPALAYPTTRRDPESGYTLHGRWFDDPYAWLERLDDEEARAWIERRRPSRALCWTRFPGATGCGRRSPCEALCATVAADSAGSNGREFVWQADASDEKLKFMLRRGKDAPLETVLDPNTWASDEVLVFAVPSPDGTLVAFGKAVGGAHDALIHVLEVETGRPGSRPAPRHVARVAGMAAGWVRIFLRGISRAGGGARGRRVAVARRLRAPARVGCSGPAGLRRRPREAVLVRGRVSECGRFAVLYQWDFVHANVVYLLRLADDALVPVRPTCKRSIRCR